MSDDSFCLYVWLFVDVFIDPWRIRKVAVFLNIVTICCVQQFAVVALQQQQQQQ